MTEQRPCIRALFIDLDGVIRDWTSQDDAGIERKFGLPKGSLKATAFAPELIDPAITGRITDEAWRRQVIDRLRERYPAAEPERAMEAWSAPAGEVDHAVLELAQMARRRVPVALITNATSRLDTDLAELGILDVFDHIVNSSVVGAAKPDRAIFTHALGLVGATAAETLYVDDTERYIGPAAELGLVCHHHRGIDELRATLARHGLLS